MPSGKNEDFLTVTYCCCCGYELDVFGTVTPMKTSNDSDFFHSYRSELEASKGYCHHTGAAFNWNWIVVHIIW